MRLGATRRLRYDGGEDRALDRPPHVLVPVSRFPSSDVDLAFVIPDAVPATAPLATLREADPLVVSAELFDVFRSDQLGDDRRSLAYTVRLQALDHTLTDAEVAAARDALIAAVSTTHGATLRA